MLAVVPGLAAPLQAILSFLPQIAIAGLALATAAFRPQAYVLAWRWASDRRRFTLPASAILLAVAGTAFAWNMLAKAAPPLPPAETRDGWWCFRGDAARSGGDGSAVGAKAGRLWAFRETLDRMAWASSPAVWGGRVYVGNDNCALYCFHGETGDVLWTAPTRYPVFSSPAVVNGRVYFGEGIHHHADARLYCHDAASGAKLWAFQTTSHVECSPTIANGKIWFGAGDDGVYCLDEKTGEKIWQARGMHVDGSPLLVDGLVVVGAGYGETGVGACRAGTGEKAWFTRLPASSWGPPAIGPAGLLVGIGNGNFEHRLDDPRAEIVCLSPQSGGIVWRTTLRDACLAAVAVRDGRAFVGDNSGDLSAFDAADGRRLWTFNCGHGVLSSAALAGNAVVFGCNGGHVHALRPDDGSEIWRHDVRLDSLNTDRRFLSSPALSGGRVYIGCNNFFFYCLGE
jgi:outer membrane protein assembly factor BamB